MATESCFLSASRPPAELDLLESRRRVCPQPLCPVLEPAGPRLGLGIMASVAALFVPATAVDKDGNRIGQGGGYYDVLLDSLAGNGLEIPFAAIVFDSELLPAGSIPAEDFDRRVPAALTPSGLIRLPDPA
ncbi:5-formyltetrahydrofolate cyclo-ligase [Arthrobacter sp. Hiyo4]|nr:5-formyltetrahydrofolate cyclo-ligase [Arthrobacter sp. Hiyo4]